MHEEKYTTILMFLKSLENPELDKFMYSLIFYKML